MRELRPHADRICLRDFTPAAALLSVSAVGILGAGLSPSGGHSQYAVIAPPWYTSTQTAALVVATGGDIVEFGGFANVIIAHSESLHYVTALYRGGAWLVIDPERARGCFQFERTPESKTGGS